MLYLYIIDTKSSSGFIKEFKTRAELNGFSEGLEFSQPNRYELYMNKSQYEQRLRQKRKNHLNVTQLLNKI